MPVEESLSPFKSEIIDLDEFNRRFGNLETFKPQVQDTTKQEKQIVKPPAQQTSEVISEEEFTKRFGSPQFPLNPSLNTPVGSTESPTEDSFLVDLTEGYANLVGGLSDALNLFVAYGEEVGKATGLPKGELVEGIANWLHGKAEKAHAETAPILQARPAPDSFFDYIYPKIPQTVLQQGPLMAAFLGTTLANPTAGTALMFGVEGGSTMRTIQEYEEGTGKPVDPYTKMFAPLVVGSFNAALEKTGVDIILGKLKVPGVNSKLLQVLMGALGEGGTETLQEVNQIIAEAGYQEEVPKDIGNRLFEIFYGGLVLGTLGTAGRVYVDGKIDAFKKKAVAAEPEATEKPEVKQPVEAPPPQPRQPLVIPELGSAEEAAKFGVSVNDFDVPSLKSQIEDLANHIAKTKATFTQLQEEGIELWHGAGEEFEAFDPAFLYSGQGANTFGEGFYLADLKTIGTGYAEAEGAKRAKLTYGLQDNVDNIGKLSELLKSKGLVSGFSSQDESGAPHMLDLMSEEGLSKLVDWLGSSDDKIVERGVSELAYNIIYTVKTGVDIDIKKATALPNPADPEYIALLERQNVLLTDPVNLANLHTELKNFIKSEVLPKIEMSPPTPVLYTVKVKPKKGKFDWLLWHSKYSPEEAEKVISRVEEEFSKYEKMLSVKQAVDEAKLFNEVLEPLGIPPGIVDAVFLSGTSFSTKNEVDIVNAIQKYIFDSLVQLASESGNRAEELYEVVQNKTLSKEPGLREVYEEYQKIRFEYHKLEKLLRSFDINWEGRVPAEGKAQLKTSRLRLAIRNIVAGSLAEKLANNKPIEKSPKLESLRSELALSKNSGEQITGGKLHHLLRTNLFNGSKSLTSKVLLDAGFDGVKYESGTLQHKDEGGYNYVIFDPTQMEITSKGAPTEQETKEIITSEELLNRLVKQGVKKQLMLEALSAKLKKHMTYSPEEGFVEHDQTAFDQEMVFKAVYGMRLEDALAWAKTQIDESEWINYFMGKGEAPMNFEDGAVTEVQQAAEEVLSERVPENTKSDDVEIEYKKTASILAFTKKFLFPEFLLRNMRLPLSISSKLINAQLQLNKTMRDYEMWYKKLSEKLSKEDRKLVRPLIELAYKLKDPNTRVYQYQGIRDQMDAIIAKQPRLIRVLDGIDKRGGLIEIFEHIKYKYKNYLKAELLTPLSPNEQSIITSYLEAYETTKAEGKLIDLIEKAQGLIAQKLPIEQMVKEELDRKYGAGTYDTLAEKKIRKKRVSVIARETRRLLLNKDSVGAKIIAVDKWGLRDYMTNIELGSYRILDGNGKIVGFAETLKDAKRKAYEIRKEAAEEGLPLEKFTIEASVSHIKPTAKRKGALHGEEDIFDALPKYIYSMEKRILIQPVIDEYKQLKKDNPKEFTADVKSIIQAQINAIVGANYSLGDKLFDNIATTFGWRTGLYSKGLGKARATWAKLKLGYRPTAALFNFAGGFGNTLAYTGNRIFAKAFAVNKAGVYKNPDGQMIDMKKKLQEIEEKGLLAIDLAVNEAGELDTRVKWYKPLGLFQLPEKFIRPHSFTANYIYQVEELGLNDQQATEAAILNLRFQQTAYNMAAIPEIFRSPGGRLIGQFKSYFINQMQFLSTLNRKQMMRMVGIQLMMAGPRGFIYMLKTIPILGAAGLLDDAEEWLVKKHGTMADFFTRGIGGLIGADVSAPASLQFPSKPEDWAGPFLGDVYRLTKDVILPGLQTVDSAISGAPTPAYVTDQGIDWMTSLSPLMYYWKDLYSSTLSWEQNDMLTKLQKPDVWVRDSNGNKAYKIGGIQDRILLTLGIAPVEKTQYQVLKRGWIEDAKIMQENRQKWFNKMSKRLIEGKELDPDLIQDAFLYRIDPSQLPKSIIYKQMSPQQRETLRARLFDRAEAFDRFMLETK